MARGDPFGGDGMAVAMRSEPELPAAGVDGARVEAAQDLQAFRDGHEVVDADLGARHFIDGVKGLV